MMDLMAIHIPRVKEPSLGMNWSKGRRIWILVLFSAMEEKLYSNMYL
ncbi:hypothetical protein PAHAL_3G081600 [Panicum hallii]|uniref:Uncharacterized protein n=1 Tax=Panicum hallii TaxID=206008 RepID=A0A2S3H728_9POAL|nr:hypothetical protein PAHAL_3G081600 [Panicum hallii]